MSRTPKYPDPSVCRTKRHVADLWECLVDKPYFCTHQLSFGYRLYCLHKFKHTFTDPIPEK